MIISLNTIKKFTSLPPLPVDQIAEQMTEASCEVEDIIYLNQHLKIVISVKIVAIDHHPESEHLHLATFFDGQTERMVVCGAPNLRVGLVTAFAPVGATLPQGITLEPKKIRGILSEGMLCSINEIGLGTENDGIIELDPTTPLGQAMDSIFEIECDTLFEIDHKSITNRGDLWGFYGMAFEMAALFSQPFTDRYDEMWLNMMRQTSVAINNKPIKFTIDPNSCCIAYHAVSMDSLDSRPSPLWMQQSLLALGMRPINALVDISNYVMLELGIPTHFYDCHKIEGGSLHVITLQENELFTTLDDKERLLVAGDSVISDEQKPLVVAAIMGGKNSMVDEYTSSIVIESALWQAEEVRKTGLRIGLRTDSSVRYEKSLDAALLERSLWRCVELIKEVFPKSRLTSKPFSYINPVKLGHTAYTVAVNIDQFNRVMGLKLSPQEAAVILERLAFTVEIQGRSGLLVTPPSWRSTKDKMTQASIFEEIARIHGYSNIKASAPLWSLQPAVMPTRTRFERKIQDFFVLHGQALEVFTHPMTGEKELQKAQWPNLNPLLCVANSVSPEHDRMRPSLTPSMLSLCALNQKNFNSFRCFEYGRAFLSDDYLFSSDRYHLAVLLFDRQKSNFLTLVDLTEKFLHYMAISFNLRLGCSENLIVEPGWVGIHPHERASISIEGKAVGLLNSVHPSVLKGYKIKGHATILELDLTALIDRPLLYPWNYKELDRYPTSSFDCTIIVEPHDQGAKPLEILIMEQLPFVTQVQIADLFTLPNKQRAITLRSHLKHEMRTLSSDEIKTTENLIVSTLAKHGYYLKS